jgi:hypothetical protein
MVIMLMLPGWVEIINVVENVPFVLDVVVVMVFCVPKEIETWVWVEGITPFIVTSYPTEPDCGEREEIKN